MDNLLAQTQPPVGDIAGWLQLIGPVGIAGILAWYLYYHTSVAIPAKDREHRDAMKELAEQTLCQVKDLNAQNNDTVRAVFAEIREDREKDRQARREDIAAIKAGFRCEGSGIHGSRQ